MLSAVVLRILSDIGIYMTFAGTVAAAAGAAVAPMYYAWGALTAAFLLSWLLRERGRVRFGPLALPAVVYAFTVRTVPGWIMLAPISFYTVFLIYKQRYDPEHSFEGRLFSVYWKVVPAPVVLCLLDRRGTILSSFTLPVVFITLLSLILLVRSLRHSPEMRSSVKYQLGELSAVLAAGAAAFVLSSETALRLFAACARGIYKVLILPVLYLAVRFIVAAARAIAKLVYLLKVNFAGGSGESVTIQMPALEEFAIEGIEDTETNPIVGKVILAVGILVVVVVVFLFFRWMAGNFRRRRDYSGSGVVRTTEPEMEDALPGYLSRNNVGKVRSAYRKFLKLTMGRGIERRKSDSSLEVLNSCAGVFTGDGARRLRELYIRARYDDSATSEDAASAKRIVSELKKE